MSVIQGVNGDGGQLNQARVSKDGRLFTRGVVKDNIEKAVDDGNGYQVYSGKVNLASDAKQALFYLRNGAANPIFVTSFNFSTTVSTGGADNVVLLEQVGNVLSTDDIVNNGTELIVFNRNIGSANQFNGVAKVGPNADFTQGVATGAIFGEFLKSESVDVTTKIPVGGMLGISLEPPAGNTSMDVVFTINFHVTDE